MILLSQSFMNFLFDRFLSCQTEMTIHCREVYYDQSTLFVQVTGGDSKGSDKARTEGSSEAAFARRRCSCSGFYRSCEANCSSGLLLVPYKLGFRVLVIVNVIRTKIFDFLKPKNSLLRQIINIHGLWCCLI